MPKDANPPINAASGEGKAPPARPQALIPEPDNIPAELRDRDRWVVWRYELVKGRWTKVPYRSDGAGKASTTNANTWSTFKAAWAAYDTGDYDGIGFVVGDGITAGDIDHCRTPDGEVNSDARAALETVKTYTEWSPSNTGVRFLAFGTLPPKGRKRGPFEMYDGDGGRYVTITGHHVDGTPTTIEQRYAELAAVHARFIAKPEGKAKRAASRNGQHSAPTGHGLSDEDVLTRMFAAENGATVKRLFDGDTSAHGDDHSTADMALVGHLAFWADDEAQADRLFRRSKLMRDKWDEQRGAMTYGERTIANAFADRGETYRAPAPHRDPDDPGPSDADADRLPTTVVIDEDLDAEPWPDPQPFPHGAPAAPQLEPDLLPQPLRDWAVDAAQRASVPLDSFVPGILVTLGATIGNRWRIRPKQYDPWTVVPNIWGALVQPSGQMKSYVLGATVEPLRKIEAELRNRFEDERVNAEVDQEILAAQLTHAQDRLKSAIKANDRDGITEARMDLVRLKEDQESTRTAAPSLLVNDTTVERLVELHRENPRGLLLNRDELHGWYANLQKQGREGDRAFYLEAHDGDRRYSQHRIKRGHVEAPIVTLSILGGIQPSRLQVMREGAISGEDADGLLQRFQALVWPDEMPPYVLDDRPRQADLDEKVLGLYSRLYDLDPARHGYDDGAPGVTRFDPDAQRMFYAWLEALEQQIRSPATQAKPAWASYLGKTRSLMPSIALALHLVELVLGRATSVSVTPEATDRAARLTDYLAGHAAKLYAPELNREEHTARLLVEKIAAGQVTSGMRVRNIYNAGWSGLGRAEVEQALAVLEHIGWARVDRVTAGKTGGRPKAVLRLHPDIEELVEGALS